MARVTVEDCILKVPDRFELVMVAAQRVRDIVAGSPITVDRDRDKNPVVALREIADDKVVIDELREGLVKRNQKLFMNTDESEETIDMIDGEEAWANMAQDALANSREDLDFNVDDEDDEDRGSKFKTADIEEDLEGEDKF